MTQKIKAFRVSKVNLAKNKMPNYTELCDGVTNIVPIKIRNNGSYGYHIAEDVKGDIFLIEDFLVTQYKLYDRNIGITETNYLLDGIGKSQIEKNNIKKQENLSLQKENVSVESDIEVDVEINISQEASAKDVSNLVEDSINALDIKEESEEESLEVIQRKIQELRQNKNKGVENGENI